MQIKKIALTSTALLRGFLVFILLLSLSLWVLGYQVFSTYVVEKQHSLSTIAGSMQKRIDKYRVAAYQLYDATGKNDPQALQPNGAQEVRLRPDVYFVDKPHKKTDAMIFGSHESATYTRALAMSRYLDVLWGAENNNFTLYYLNGSDNSLTLISTQPLRDTNPRFRDSYIGSLVDSRRGEMLQQANILDERESFSPLRKYRFLNDYYFTQRMIFNQPGHLATIIAFDLPINDIIPLNMARANFALNRTPDRNATDSDADDDDIDDAQTPRVYSRMSGAMLEIAAPLSNAPLSMTYRVSLISLALDLLHNNLWLVLIDLVLMAFSLLGIYLVRKNLLRPNTDMVQQLKSHQTLGQEVIANLPLGLLIYNFSDNTLVASNKIADHLLPHLSLQKIANLAEGHQGVIQATVNNEVYEIRMFKSQIAPQTWLFQLLDQDKEVLVNKKLQQAQRELDKNHEARQAILNNIQQELNAPLAVIGLLVDRITASQEEQQVALLAQLRQESSRLMGLTDNLQLLTRLELQEWQPASAPVNLHQLCDDVLRDRLPLLSQKGLGLFHHYLLPFDRHYTGDAQAVSKVIALILDYAITTTHFGKITLRVSGDDAGGAITFSLSDTGSGIGEQELANLSQPFVSAAQQDRYQRGSGLTWFLCDQLCRRMGGRLAIQSRVDIGTRYTLSLPLAPLEGNAGDEAEKLLEDTLVLLDIRNEEIRAIVSGMLEQWGAECVYVDEHHLGQEHDLLMTDDPARMEDYALLLDGDAQGVMALTTRSIKVNYNFSAPMLEAILQLIEQRLGEPEDERDQATGEPMSAGGYQNRLQDRDYYALFVETVPDDVKRLYTEAESGDLNALAQTAHRLKGVFAMLGLEPGKRACESLELYIKQQDIAKMGSEIHQIDVFVTKMLQHAR